MAINFKPAASDPAHDQMVAQRGGAINMALAALQPAIMPEPHMNTLFDNMMGFKPHAFAPTDIANNPVNSH